MLLSAPAWQRTIAAVALLTTLLACTKSGSDPARPGAPTGLAANASGPRSAQLSWSIAGTGEAGIRVERRTGTAPSATIAELGPGTTSFEDSGLAPRTRYAYRVRAFNAAGPSAPSDEVAVTTLEGSPPEFALAFPPPGSRIAATDRDRITVAGTVDDETGIESVMVNGVTAAELPDGTWSAEVRLAPGDNEIVVATADPLGNAGERTVTTVRRESPLLTSPRGAAIDVATDRVVFTDPASGAILAIDRLTRTVSTISSATVGSGPAFGRPIQISVDDPAMPRRALVVDRGLAALFELDLLTGARRIITDQQTGSGVTFDGRGDVVWNGSSQAWTTTHVFGPAILGVDLTNGHRRVVSSWSVGSGPGTWSPLGLAQLDATTLLVTDVASGAVVAVDTATGDRTVVSSDNVGSGPSLGYPNDIAVGPNRSVAFVSDTALAAIVMIDLATGGRTIVSDAATGSGPAMPSPTELEYDHVLHRVIVSDQVADCVLSIDPANGHREPLHSPRIGAGELLGAVRAPDLVTDGARVFVPDPDRARVLAIALSTGDRTTVSGPARGTGPALEAPHAIAVDASGGRLFVAENIGADLRVLAIDVATGDRTIVSDAAHGMGANMEAIAQLAYLASDDALIASGWSLAPHGPAVFHLDLRSGIRREVSGPSTGTGIGPGLSSGLALDDAGNRALLLSTMNPEGLVSVDLATGDRTLVSGFERGSGPRLYNCAGFVVDRTGGWALTQLFPDGVLLRIDLSNGDRTVVGDPSTPLGPVPLVAGNTGLALLDERLAIRADPFAEPVTQPPSLDQSRAAVYAVDVATGESVVIAR